MATVDISYKGETIGTVASGETKTLKVAGKYCEDDISLEITGASDNSNLIYEPYTKEIFDSDGNLIEAELHGHEFLRNSAFSGCQSLSAVSLPDSLTSIGQQAFSGCTNLALTLLPSCLKSIDYGAFYGCTSLALTSLPAGLTDIGVLAFYGCESLALTSLPAGLTSIGASAFEWCTALTTLTFEGTPDSISATAFNNCNNLTTINVPWAEGAVENAPWGAENATINYNYTGD